MKYYLSQILRRNDLHPAHSIMGSVCKKTFSSFSSSSSLAQIATLGLGVTFLLSYMPGLFRSAKGSSHPEDDSSTKKETYFDAAPRSISGQHPSYSEYAGTNNGLFKKSGQLAVGSVALFGLLYLFSRKK